MSNILFHRTSCFLCLMILSWASLGSCWWSDQIYEEVVFVSEDCFWESCSVFWSDSVCVFGAINGNLMGQLINLLITWIWMCTFFLNFYDCTFEHETIWTLFVFACIFQPVKWSDHKIINKWINELWAPPFFLCLNPAFTITPQQFPF